MKRISVTVLLLGLLVAATASAEDVYRWRDENGKVHYGRTLPPEYATRPHEILNSAGVVIERIEDPMARPEPEPKPDEEKKSDELEPLFTEEEVRFRSDNLLILRYYTEEDLLEAMENEVAQLSYDIRLINQSQISALTSLAGHVKNAADRQRAGMSEDEAIKKNIHSLRRRLRKSENSLSALKQREAEIRASFATDLARYRFLKNGGKPGSLEINNEIDPEINPEINPEIDSEINSEIN